MEGSSFERIEEIVYADVEELAGDEDAIKEYFADLIERLENDRDALLESLTEE